MTRSVTIVGAGPGGLASAMLLARAGLRVRVLERLDTPGGEPVRLKAEPAFGLTLVLHSSFTQGFWQTSSLRADMTSIMK